PVPKKDAMGMDYVPVYEGEEAPEGQVRISPDRLQTLGVRTERAALRPLARTLRLTGTVALDERRESTVSARFEGWITALHVATTGERVVRGEALLEVYSPDLVTAQEDYRVAVAALEALNDGEPEARAGAERLVAGSLERLRNWDIAEAELAALRRGGAPRRTLTLRAQRDGVVIDKPARVGMRFMPGEPLYQIADLSAVWLVASVFEQDLGLVHVGQGAEATLVAYPGRTFKGTVAFVSPVLAPETRTAEVRLEFANREGLLKPAMYASVALAAGPAAPRLAVPDSAVLDTGTRQLVLVDRGGGAFEPRHVTVGARADGYAEILAGLSAGDAVVVDGNFLIDSESNLGSAVRGLAGHGPAETSPAPAPAHAHDAGAH
ncbi:MAG: efflux RND transporter periplasmic adaptor subunit, partial [Proteobacteria bacterium]|nr:efflux RND transporter periplasmic adaptor subunit [Pseudomonadota bacterium]